MSVPKRIVEYIREMRPQPVCDHCVYEQLKLARHQQARHTTSAIGHTIEFAREKGTCSICGNRRNATRAV